MQIFNPCLFLKEKISLSNTKDITKKRMNRLLPKIMFVLCFNVLIQTIEKLIDQKNCLKYSLPFSFSGFQTVILCFKYLVRSPVLAALRSYSKQKAN